MSKVLVTGSQGFIAKNLIVRLKESNNEVITFDLMDDISLLNDKVKSADYIYHLAGVNRPKDISEFTVGNVDLTTTLIECVKNSGRNIPLVFSSSIQAKQDNPYGESKLSAENRLIEYSSITGNSVYIYRLPNVFGKWCKPNYNSVVATFCHNIINGLPISVNDESKILSLVYIDDVIDSFISLLDNSEKSSGVIYKEIPTVYEETVGEIANKISKFKDSRESLITDAVGYGFTRALYSTYLSYLPPDDFSYRIPSYEDDRGAFAEILKTPEYGQFSFFTAKPGVTRGGHYHHSKNEKFIVVSGVALFKFVHIVTGEVVEQVISSEDVRVLETAPGWAHNIKNIGEADLIVMLWANEIFDRNKPDTVSWEM